MRSGPGFHAVLGRHGVGVGDQLRVEAPAESGLRLTAEFIIRIKDRKCLTIVLSGVFTALFSLTLLIIDAINYLHIHNALQRIR